MFLLECEYFLRSKQNIIFKWLNRMARKSHRASRTKSRKHTKRQRSTRQRRTRRHQGGSHTLMGAPLSDSLAGSWSSKMSMGQGGDAMKYRAGQLGGYLAGAPVGVVGREGLPASMQGSAMTASTLRAYADIAGLKDQHGGRRKKHGKRSKKHRKSRSKRSNRSKRQRRTRSKRSKRQRGGSKLEFAPVSGAGMLLSDYSKTGLSPQWSGGVEFSAAAARQAM